MITTKNKINGKPVSMDVSQEYEKISFFLRAFNFFWMVVATIFPYKWGHKLLIQSKKAEVIKTFSTQYRALEEMYNFTGKQLKPDWVSLFDFIWLNQRNPRALRNRLRLFKKILMNEINQRSKSKKNISIVSLGSGSARGVVEVISEIDLSLINIQASLVDRDINAINYSRELARKYGVGDNVNQHLLNIEDSYDLVSKKAPDIIEMVGIVDYFDDEKIVRVFNKLYGILNSGSTIITSNINKNFEEKFISKTVKWRMVHRSPVEFFDILHETNFADDFEIIYEPLMIHGLGILRKK